MLPKIFIYTFSIIFSISIVSNANADQSIEIVGGTGAGVIKVAVIGFTNEDANKNASNIITNDLNITGEFSATKYPNASSIDSNTQYTVSGTITDKTITYKLIRNSMTQINADTNTNTQAKSITTPTLLINQQLTFANEQDIRRAAHVASNAIYEKLTNSPGIFTSKIAYIIKNKKEYQLMIADYDGYNSKSIIKSSNPLTSLAWSPNDRQIAYTSFESGKPVVHVQDVYQINRYVTANFDGSNSSPSFTQDGTKLATTLSKDYGSHIYLINNTRYSATTQATSLIKFGTIDTEASFDRSDRIIFTSNHDGGPQIFMTNLHGGEIKRLTINLGNYNTSAKFAHTANKITFVNRDAGELKAYIMDLSTIPAISYPINLGTSLDTAPSFAPNDKLVLFSSNNSLYIVNTAGTIKTELTDNIKGQQIIDQSWGNNY